MLAHNTYILVGDGRKALFLRNVGDATRIDLRIERVFKDQNPSTHEQGADRPGRSHSSVGSNRSSIEQTDWHHLEENKFAHEVARALEMTMQEHQIDQLIVVAPPRTLAELRKTFHKDVTSKIIAEIGKDLTKHSISDIEKYLRDSTWIATGEGCR
jgi:protein required for attachment to host cells